VQNTNLVDRGVKSEVLNFRDFIFCFFTGNKLPEKPRTAGMFATLPRSLSTCTVVAKPGSLVFLLLFLVLDTVSGASDDISRHDVSWRCVSYRLTRMVTTKEPAEIR